MSSAAHPFLRRLARPLALALGLLSLLFLLQVTVHSHANGQDEPACRLCQVAHVGVTSAVSAITFSVPFVSFGSVSVGATRFVSEPLSDDAPSRAPPVSIAL
jgi:hypothetical protein